MSSATAIAIVAKPPGLTHKHVIAAGIGLAAALWFVLLSGWLGVKPGSVFVQRQNVLFNSDTSIWIGKMIGNGKPITQAVHPLEMPLWRPPCQALYHFLQVFLPSEYAGVLAARIFVALVAGIGVGFLAFLALQNEVGLPQCILLFITYLLFTSSSTIALPEHFGISNGLLSIAFVAPIIVANPRTRMAVLAAMVVLCGGTTITNVLYPLASLYQYGVKSARARMGTLLAAAPIALGIAFFLFFKSFTIHAYVKGYSSLRLLHHPASALVYAIYALVAPAVGPTPLVLRYPGWDMVSYEPAYQPLHLSYYLGMQAVGAIAWSFLFLKCSYEALKDQKTRPYVWLPLGWILFSILFHNIWGDELQLYAPHWSWALMGMVLLGARHLSRKATVAVVVPMIACQVYTLFMIKKALLTIVQ